MENADEEEESCRQCMSQTSSIRGWTADGSMSHHRAHPSGAHIQFVGDWGYRDGEIEENINGKLMGIFSNTVIKIAAF